MRIGAKQTGQCFHVLHDGKGNACALGAAYFGKYGQLPENGMWIVKSLGISYHLADLIAEKNDGEGLSREQIADWLESQGL